MMLEHNIELTAFQDEDVALFIQWLDKGYIYKWFCCGGDESEQACVEGLEERQAWHDEVTNRDDNPHRHLYIATCNGNKIGFGICLDLAGEDEVEYVREQYPDLIGLLKPRQAFEIGYCIGCEDFLNKGIGKIIIKQLETECRKLGAALLLADPNDNNI
jgi:hypothetical protein